MDPFRPIDWGAYYFFDFVSKQRPGLVSLMQAFNWLASYVPLALLTFLAAATLWRRRGPRAALIGMAVFLLALVLAEGARAWVARPRPDEAEIIVGAEGMHASYPAAGVFLFTMAMLLLTLGQSMDASVRQRVAWGLCATIAIVGVCMSQLLLRLHFVTDVVGGLFGGAACALLAYLLAVRSPCSPTRQ